MERSKGRAYFVGEPTVGRLKAFFRAVGDTILLPWTNKDIPIQWYADRTDLISVDFVPHAGNGSRFIVRAGEPGKRFGLEYIVSDLCKT
ncbi:MAG: hypothetical protein R2860_14815 [Desulfobacterales bacterium]